MKPINLNKARKSKTRADRKARANENSVKYGRSKVQSAADEAKKKKTVSFLDAHKREVDPK